MAQHVFVMVIAMVIAVGVMLVFAGAIGDFVNRHPSMKILALSFLLLIGVMLVAEGMGQHVGKGYIYFAMAFSLGVELLNMRLRKKTAPSLSTIDSSRQRPQKVATNSPVGHSRIDGHFRGEPHARRRSAVCTDRNCPSLCAFALRRPATVRTSHGSCKSFFQEEASRKGRQWSGLAEPTWGSASLRVVQGIGPKHGNHDGEKAVTDSAAGSAVGLAGSAGARIAGLPVRVATGGVFSPVVDCESEPRIGAGASDDGGPLSPLTGLLGYRRHSGQKSQRGVVSPSKRLPGLREYRGAH